MPRGMRDLTSPTRDQACAPAVEVLSLNQWTIREVHFRLLLNRFSATIIYSSTLFIANHLIVLCMYCIISKV